jgi:hypothetical protein
MSNSAMTSVAAPGCDVSSPSDNQQHIIKKRRNAEAAKRSREKKKEMQKQKIDELEYNAMRLKKESEHYQRNYRELCAERGRWKNKEQYLTAMLAKYRSMFQKQKQYIYRLESQLSSSLHTLYPTTPMPMITPSSSMYPISNDPPTPVLPVSDFPTSLPSTIDTSASGWKSDDPGNNHVLDMTDVADLFSPSHSSEFADSNDEFLPSRW